MNEIIQSSIESIRKEICDTYGVSEADAADSIAQNEQLSRYVTSVAARAMVPIIEYIEKMSVVTGPVQSVEEVEDAFPDSYPEPEIIERLAQANGDIANGDRDITIESRLSNLESKIDVLLKMISTPNVLNANRDTYRNTQPPINQVISIPVPAKRHDLWGQYQKAWFMYKQAGEGAPKHNGERSKMCAADYALFKKKTIEEQERFFNQWMK